MVNARRRGLVALLRWLLLAGWLLAQAALLAAFAAYVHLGRDLPPLESLVHYRPAQSTRVFSADGFLLAELAREHRTVLPPEAIPLRARQVFLAAEDADFYHHGGIDLAGVLRAGWAMLRRQGGPRQGGSTITQQLAKALCGREKTLARKLREAVLARRLEAVLTKDQILWTYLNHIYLGRDAYGIAAAAQAWFGRPLPALALGELAYLAGLPQRPSWFVRHPAAALARQRYVLDQMVARGWATVQEREAELARGLRFAPPRDVALWRAPYAAEAVRRELISTLGEQRVYEGGLTVETTIRLPEQRAAQEELVAGLEAIDRRQGWRGPLVRLSLAEAGRLQQSWAAGEGFLVGEDRLRPALVQQVERDAARLRAGTLPLTLARRDCEWARPFDEGATDNRGRLSDLRQILRPGDVVMVRL
ncbi:MAG: penicillin-binding protein, partial [Deltaproteobacteria bacterium]|nr:penicillin-binding protein [Deltaproteobacteria bacterium]